MILLEEEELTVEQLHIEDNMQMLIEGEYLSPRPLTLEGEYLSPRPLTLEGEYLSRVRTGPWSAWKYLKFITVFSRPWNPWKTAVFWSKCLKVLEFLLDNKSYNILQSSVKISVEEFYQIPQCTIFVAFPVLQCSVTISIN